MTLTQASLKTKQLIKTQFLMLLEKIPFDHITIIDIAAASQINRGTFYFHYKDKFDVLEEIEQQLVDDFLIITASKNIEETEPFSLHNTRSLAAMESFLLTHQQIIRILFSENCPTIFVSRLKDALVQRVSQFKQKGSLKSQAFYQLTYDISGIVGIIEVWAKAGMPESPEELVRIFQSVQTNCHLSPSQQLF